MTEIYLHLAYLINPFVLSSWQCSLIHYVPLKKEQVIFTQIQMNYKVGFGDNSLCTVSHPTLPYQSSLIATEAGYCRIKANVQV